MKSVVVVVASALCVVACTVTGCRTAAPTSKARVPAPPLQLPRQEPQEQEDLSPEQAGYALDTEWQERVDALDWRSGADALAVDPAGKLYVQSFPGCYIRKIGPNGKQLAQWKHEGDPGEGSDYGSGIAVDPDGELVYAVTYAGDIRVLRANGAELDVWRPCPEGEKGVHSIAVDADGHLYAAVGWTTFGGILKLTTDGELLNPWDCARWGRPLGNTAVEAGPTGEVFVLGQPGPREKAVQRLDGHGTLLAAWGTLGSAAGELWQPFDIAVDAVGNVYVADSRNTRVQKFTQDGKFLAKWRIPKNWDADSRPQSVDVDAAGNVYVADGRRPVKFRPLKR